MTFRAVVVTVSDRVSRGEVEDGSGPALVRLLEDNGYEITGTGTVADDRHAIVVELGRWIAAGASLLLTTGGTGFSPRDVTPEATVEVIDRRADGLSELMRREGSRHTPMAALSRGIAGMAGATLVINLPGSTKGATESLTALLEVLPHALRTAAGDTGHQ